ncbi:hypothetical protein CRE_08367 [Caenorhabditis remanei]|uniref:Uncharacterized protein n=1 Tax=Caenorhabditis remanei TaxID=31234 RepID=E3MPD4_CAERE|nr:hypothetical protein CRE_08367 [Caenorhabditis remanei]
MYRSDYFEILNILLFVLAVTTGPDVCPSIRYESSLLNMLQGNCVNQSSTSFYSAGSLLTNSASTTWQNNFFASRTRMNRNLQSTSTASHLPTNSVSGLLCYEKHIILEIKY